MLKSSSGYYMLNTVAVGKKLIHVLTPKVLNFMKIY